MKNYVYIATSLDGYIADKENKLDWLPSNSGELDLKIKYPEMIEMIDCIVMGANTYKTVCGFDIDWPYSKPVFVISNSITKIPKELKGKVQVLNGSTESIINNLHEQGYKNLYIDGGITIQNFLKKDLIDEIIITVIPILLGDGIPLFSQLENRLNFECVSSSVDKGIVQSHFKRIK